MGRPLSDAEAGPYSPADPDMVERQSALENALHTCGEILGTRTAKEFTLRRQRGLSTLLDTQLSCSSTLARIKTEWGKDAKNRDQMDGAEAGS